MQQGRLALGMAIVGQLVKVVELGYMYEGVTFHHHETCCVLR